MRAFFVESSSNLDSGIADDAVDFEVAHVVVKPTKGLQECGEH